MAVKPNEEGTGVAAVERALGILHAFRDGDGALSLVELSRRTGLYKSTLLRLAVSLERLRFLARQEDGRFRLGSALLFLGGVYERAFDLRHIVQPVLVALAESTGESATLEIREGAHRVIALRAEGREIVREHLSPGIVLPLDRGAPARVLLAYGVAPEQRPPVRVHVSLGERNPEIAGVAAPVFGVRQALVGALCGSGTVARLSAPGRMDAMRREVFARARSLTAALGGDASAFERMEPEDI